MSELECVWTYIAELSFPCPGLRYWLINVPKKKKKTVVRCGPSTLDKYILQV